ncbi:hypothetical protein BU23DRAFT_576180 [Bimuria novae-zelandiae CBS 107.79]|uniref:Centromere protein X n=1 Tax=Bimuria novae-zelandiae CBS 107.79 TaxID=1447943 RepID=A0A6A5VTK2_9PLEO|nr:hypothetical protein BU23DRAFT_576180 [Bimuria novae-zelandiae CBS 107.79]
MPPKAAPPRRKGPAFNPPRPVKPPTSTTAPAAGRASNAAASRPAPAPAPAKPSAARSSFQPTTTIISSDDEQEDEFDDLPSDIDALMEDAIDDKPRPQRAAALVTATPPIPPPLLVRLLHHNFEDENTQIQKGAMKLFESYMTIFVREAIARAKDEREKTGRDVGGAASRFLQVEDLEKLAPELLLDF